VSSQYGREGGGGGGQGLGAAPAGAQPLAEVPRDAEVRRAEVVPPPADKDSALSGEMRRPAGRGQF
jgi:hypothetical protein